jgi:hypothetical protein
MRGAFTFTSTIAAVVIAFWLAVTRASAHKMRNNYGG